MEHQLQRAAAAASKEAPAVAVGQRQGTKGGTSVRQEDQHEDEGDLQAKKIAAAKGASAPLPASPASKPAKAVQKGRGGKKQQPHAGSKPAGAPKAKSGSKAAAPLKTKPAAQPPAKRTSRTSKLKVRPSAVVLVQA
jgi:hypothetical protein